MASIYGFSHATANRPRTETLDIRTRRVETDPAEEEFRFSSLSQLEIILNDPHDALREAKGLK